MSLHLPKEPKGSVLDGGYPSPSRALSWNYLLTDMFGRGAQKQELLDWAETGPGEARLRLLHGVGGSGKTRLAYEVASALDAEGSDWNAGFLAKDTEHHITVHTPNRGVLIIVDYPEERMAFVDSLVDGLRDRAEAYVSVRVLLVSRLDQSHWQHASNALGHRFSVQDASATEPLSLEDASALVNEVNCQLVDIAESKSANPKGAEAWLKADEMHRLPLFATAAALHAYLAPNDAFGLNGAEVVEALALIERDRVRAYSQSAGLGEYGLERLLALGTFSKAGLSQPMIESLGDDGLPLGLVG